MPYGYSSVAWESNDGVRFALIPNDPNSDLEYREPPEDSYGVKGYMIHAYDPSNGDEHFFWAWTDRPYHWSDDNWMDYIEALMGGHGMLL